MVKDDNIHTKEYRLSLHFVTTGEVGGGGFNVILNLTMLIHKYEDIISIENLLEAWKEFVVGKKNRKDVQDFQRYLMSNIIKLHGELNNQTYAHSDYETFNLSDPKPRIIHKAKVRDRLLHHAVYRVLYPYFSKKFIADSYSCQNNKGTHKSVKRFHQFARRLSRNHSRQLWVLKCDVKKFFASIDQEKLMDILKKNIIDHKLLKLMSVIIYSFSSTHCGVGLPLGNLTSQLLVNIYMNEFDQYIKHRLRIKYYLRYADDFVIMSDKRDYLVSVLKNVGSYLTNNLYLKLHPDKVSIKTISSGVDYLGWVNFPNHRVIRTSTKNKMMRKLAENPDNFHTRQSYLGLLSHGNTHKIVKSI